MRRKISQRDARNYRERVKELENVLDDQRRKWSNDWPGGIRIWNSEGVSAEKMAVLRTAKVLGHAVVAVADPGTNIVRYYALNPDNP